MKLYHTPGACSTASLIVIKEVGIPVELVQVDLKTKMLADGGSLLGVNPKGQVPTLVLDSGEVLTEGAVIMQFIADQAPQAGLLPPPGDMKRYRVLGWVNYVATELHKTFSPLNRPYTPLEFREITKAMLLPRVFGVLNETLKANQYLAGDTFTIADAYAFVVLQWTKIQQISLLPWPSIEAYLERIEVRPSVRSVYQRD